MQTTYTLDWLELPLIRHDTNAPLADVILVTPADVTVEYDYHPAEREIMRPDPNDCQQGYPDEVEVFKVVCTEPMLFDNEGITLTLAAGFELTHLLPRTTLDKMEEAIIGGIRSHRRAA
jgi:hypothetical protein